MNASKEGTRRADGPKFPKIGCIEVLEAMKNHPHWNSPIEEKNMGRGIAIGFWFNGGGPSNCSIGVNQDGTINLVEGSPDIADALIFTFFGSEKITPQGSKKAEPDRFRQLRKPQRFKVPRSWVGI